jgi:LPS-assembly protein
MHKVKTWGIPLAVLCAIPLAAGAQQGLQLKSQPTLMLLPPDTPEPLPVFLEADTLRGHAEKETEAEGSARLRKRGKAVFADRMRYDKPSDEITADGNVRIEQQGSVAEGPRLRYNLTTERGHMENPSYTLHRDPRGTTTIQSRTREATDARGTAERMLFEGPGQYRAQRAEYTTCGPGDDDWYLRAKELTIDKMRDVGTARDGSIVFLGTPIFYSPYLSFTLHQERKSGFLAPTYGNTSNGGPELTVPYYWNIAPNYDATISPRVITRRGMQINGEFRYLNPAYRGEAHGEELPDDRVFAGRERHAYFLNHTQALPYGWAGTLNVNRVSDDQYFADLAKTVAVTSQVNLSNDVTLVRAGTWGGPTNLYTFVAYAQQWQTLQVDPLAPITPPYDRTPQLTLTASRPDLLHTDFDFQGHYVRFVHPALVSGSRLMAYPSISVPLQTSYAYLTPKLGVTMTKYSIEQNASGFEDHTRTLPVFSADSGLVFERQATIGGASFVQTLEPRLYYVYIPFQNQSGIPVFDTGLQDINFATIYAENQFAGWDRVNDANQLTVGLTTRFLSADTGSERLRVGVAQRYYFTIPKVTLPGVAAPTSSSSDLLAALTGTVAPHWFADAGVQYNTDSSEVKRFNVGVRYQPAPGKVLNMSYRETADTVQQTDVSGQWPLGRGWTAVGRWNYSLLDNLSVETLGGIEYTAGCWVFRAIAHRFATTSQKYTSAFFVQLELNGVASIGSNPLEALRRNIGGYVRDPRNPTPLESRGALY